MSDSKPKVIPLEVLITSVILKWLCEKGYAFCANVGQYEEEQDFSAIEAKSPNVGPTKCVITDLRKDFVENHVYETIIKCNGVYESRYLLGTSMSRQGNDPYRH